MTTTHNVNQNIMFVQVQNTQLVAYRHLHEIDLAAGPVYEIVSDNTTREYFVTNVDTPELTQIVTGM